MLQRFFSLLRETRLAVESRGQLEMFLGEMEQLGLPLQLLLRLRVRQVDESVEHPPRCPSPLGRVLEVSFLVIICGGLQLLLYLGIQRRVPGTTKHGS